MTTAEKIRAYIQEHGPISASDLARAQGLKFAVAWGYCRPMVQRGMLACDEQGRYTFVRHARTPLTPAEVLAKRQANWRVQGRRRLEKRQAARLASPPPPPKPKLAPRLAKAIRAVDVSTRAERAGCARDMRNKEIGIPAGIVPAAPKVESVADFLARGGSIKRLGNGEVSQASRFLRLEVRA